MSSNRRLISVDVRTMILKHSQEAGSQSSYAKSIGVSSSYLSDILKGKREPGHKILKALGLVRIVEYIDVAECRASAPSGQADGTGEEGVK